MSTSMPPPDPAWTLRVLAGHLDTIVPLRARPAELAWAKRYLREREAQVLRPVEFVIRPGSQLLCSAQKLPASEAVGSRADKLVGTAHKLPASGDDELVGASHKLPASGDSVARIASLDDGAFHQAMERVRPDMTRAFADGKLIPFAGRGLVIAHQAIDALQHDATLDVAELAPDSPRPDSVVREALRRAGAAADRVDHRLGAAIAALAIRRGQIIATSSAVDRVIPVPFRSATPCARDTGYDIQPGAPT